MEGFIPNLNLENVLLIAASIINLFFAILILSKDRSKISNTFFSLIAVSVALWALSRALFEIADSHAFVQLWGNILYISAALIPIFFLFFSISFGNETVKIKKRYIALIIGSYSLVLISVLIPGFVIQDISITEIGKTISFGPGNWPYSIYIIFYFLISFGVLIHKYRLSDEIQKVQIRYLFVGTFIATSIGVTTNLVLPIFGYFDLFWVGPVATVIMVGFIAFAIIRHHLFNVRVVTAELLTFILWMFIAFRVLLSESAKSRLIDIFLLLSSIVFGIILIRSVIKEIDTREEVQTLADNLKKANMRLQELDRQKSEFVSIASHQLKAPLTAIKGYASMISEESFGQISPAVRDAVDRIFKSSRNMVNVVEDFLDITRIEQGRMKYDIVPTDLAVVVRDVLSELQSTISVSGLDVDMTIPNTPIMVMADAGKVRQVVLNLIDNALKYTPKGSVHVALERNDGKAIFSVRDSGIGIPKSFTMRMFGKFNRAENGVRLHANGSGIGLYLAKEILKAHKGRIWAESEGEGKGSTFSVELPSVA